MLINKYKGLKMAQKIMYWKSFSVQMSYFKRPINEINYQTHPVTSFS